MPLFSLQCLLTLQGSRKKVIFLVVARPLRWEGGGVKGLSGWATKKITFQKSSFRVGKTKFQIFFLYRSIRDKTFGLVKHFQAWFTFTFFESRAKTKQGWGPKPCHACKGRMRSLHWTTVYSLQRDNLLPKKLKCHARSFYKIYIDSLKTHCGF